MFGQRKISIVLTGIDGSGKSTVVNYLCNALRRRGFNACVKWFRWRAFVSYTLYAYARISGFTVTIRNSRSHNNVKIHLFYLNSILKRLYPWTMYFDMLLFYAMSKVKTFFERRQVILYDRFFLDSFVDMIYETRHSLDVSDSILQNLFLRIQNKADIVILLDVDPDTAYQRKLDIISKDEIEFKRLIYKKIVKRLKNIIVVDGSQDLEHLKTNVWESINSAIENEESR